MLNEKELQQLKERKIEELREMAKKALNRGERHVSNIALNKILAIHKELGYRNLDNIIDNLATVKPAKSLDDLLYNIEHGLVAGTRTDGQKVDLDDIDLF